MGTTPSFSPVYKKNNENKKEQIGISFNGQVYLGIKHPLEALSLPKATKSTSESTKPSTKKFGFKKKSRK
jgi:hypothetical protein